MCDPCAMSTFEDEPLDADLDSERCPECGSSEVAVVPRLRLFLLFSALSWAVAVAVNNSDVAFAGVSVAAIITVFLPSRRCRECGHRWTPPAPPPALYGPEEKESSDLPE